MASIRKRTVKWQTKPKDGTPPQTRSSIKWRARIKDRRGKEHSKLFDRKRDAEKWIEEQTAALATGSFVDPASGKKSFREAAELWRELKSGTHRARTARTVEGILRLHVYPGLGNLPLAKITSDDIQLLVNSWIKEGAAPSTIENRFTILQIVFRWAVKRQDIAETPCDGITLPELPDKSSLVAIDAATIAAIRDALPEHYRALVTVGAGTGMRRGELLGLTLDRVNFLRRQIQVEVQLGPSVGGEVSFQPPKTPKSKRTIAVSQVVLDAIREHVDKFGIHETGLIFTTIHGSPLRPTTLHEAWKRAAKQVGTSATPHDLRHFYASTMIRGGLSIKALQLALGHKSAVVTWDTYGHLMGTEDERARELIENELQNVPGSRWAVAT